MPRAGGFAAETSAMDKGYKLNCPYRACEDRGGRPIMPLRETVQAGAAKAPRCEVCRFRLRPQDDNWRCPKPREPMDQGRPPPPSYPTPTPRWWKLYNGRTAVRPWLSGSRYMPTSAPSSRRAPAHSQGRKPRPPGVEPLYNRLLAPQSKPVRLGPSPRPCETHFRWLSGFRPGFWPQSQLDYNLTRLEGGVQARLAGRFARPS